MDIHARVTRLNGAHAVVTIEQEPAGCGHCREPGGCRSGLLGQIFRAYPREFSLPNGIGAYCGERVIVHLAAGSLIRCVLAGYFLPVPAVILGGALGASISGETFSRDGGAMVGALAGLLLAACLIFFRLAPGLAGPAPRLVRMGARDAKCSLEEKP